MSKILITSLGTGVAKKGKYSSAKYEIEDRLYCERFVSKALCKHIKFDKIFMIGTCRSMWDAVYETFGGKNDSIQLSLYEKQDRSAVEKSDLLPIESLWRQYFGIAGSEAFLVDYGLNERELWQNFEVFISIADKIAQDDKIYLDITHSFRSLSLMSYIMLDFIKSMRQKRFSVEAIYYGMFEYTHEPKNTEKITPIVNLKILFEISEWIRAISAFKNYGRADLIAENLKKGDTSKDEISKAFFRFSEHISIANLGGIKSYVDRMRKKIAILSNQKSPIVKLISDDLIEFINRMEKETLSDFQFEIAKWFCENKNYALSYIALAEAIISKICEKENIPVEGTDNRYKAKNMLLNDDYRKLKLLYNNVRRIRNSIAHQSSCRENSTINDINNLQRYIEKTKDEFSKLDKD